MMTRAGSYVGLRLLWTGCAATSATGSIGRFD